MDVVPVPGAHHGHLRDGEELVDVVKRRRGAGAAGAEHGGGRLVGEHVWLPRAPIGVEQAVHKAEQAAGGMRVMDRSAKHKAVGVRGELAELVYLVVEHAAAELVATAACRAPSDRLGANPKDLCLHALLGKRARNFLKGAVGAAVLMRASVDEQYLHERDSFLVWARRCQRRLGSQVSETASEFYVGLPRCCVQAATDATLRRMFSPRCSFRARRAARRSGQFCNPADRVPLERARAARVRPRAAR